MFDVVIIGAGVTGAASAYMLSKYNLKIAVFEKENDVAMGTTKANSAIIHAGYDPAPNTLMARFNVRGNYLTKEICKKLDVKCQQVGSLVVAFSQEEAEKVAELYERGIKNGVPDLEIISGKTLFEKEPGIAKNALCALWAPSAAIIEPWDFCLAMLQTAVVNGTDLFLENTVEKIEKIQGGYKITTDKGEYTAKTVINAAGINADKVHNLIAKPTFKITPHSGQYYLLDKDEGGRVNHIVFQCPVGDTKGVLVAPTVHGNLIVGPDSVLAYGSGTQTTQKGLDFVKNTAVKSVPDINFRSNIRNFAGLRAVAGSDDFIIGQAEDAKGFFDLAGIKSPGLSAAAAIGEYTVKMLSDFGLEMKEKAHYTDGRTKLRFNCMSPEEKAPIIKENPLFGRVICRCETVTEGEIVQCLRQPIPPVSTDGVKRRTSAGMGRCQGGFCGPKVLEILARELKKAPTEIVQDKAGSFILTEKL